jgi:hypothetical protein
MVVLGVMLMGNVARLVALLGQQSAHTVVKSRVNKLELPKNPTKDDVDTFVQAFRSFCAVNAVDLVAINRRATSGQGAGGAGTFIAEGVLLASSPCPVEFFHPATIKATHRKKAALKTSRPNTADLGSAYDLGFERLPE